MIDLSIIIVSYNGKDFLRKCLSSIFSNTRKQTTYEVIVVDNGSSDGLASMVKKQFPKVTLFENKENLGFSKANNQGVRLSTNSRYILFLNPDTLVYKNTIDGMIDFMNKTSDAGAATCFVGLKNGKLDDSCHRGFPTPWRSFCYFTGLSKLFPKNKFFAGYNMTYLNLTKTHKIDALGGSFMITRRGVGEKLNWWDEDFFFYGEDLDFCFRIKKLGYKIYFVPQYKALHYKGISSGIKKASEDISRATKETKLFATKHRFNAMRIFYKKHYEKKYPKLVTWFIYIAIWVKEHL